MLRNSRAQRQLTRSTAHGNVRAPGSTGAYGSTHHHARRLAALGILVVACQPSTFAPMSGAARQTGSMHVAPDVGRNEGLGHTPALLRPEVLLIDLDIRRVPTPLAARASENMSELDVLGIQEGWLVKCACRHCANTRHRLQRKPEIRTAARTEIDLQPSAGLV